MPIDEQLEQLDSWYEHLAPVAARVLGGPGSAIYVMDFIAIGAMKRSLSLAKGLSSMIKIKNMICARALLRMQIDTVARFLAYTYVDDPDALARSVTGGSQLKKFKCSRGKPLTDQYLIERMSQAYPWVHRVYAVTSGYVHFSERQFFDSINAFGSACDHQFALTITGTDTTFPEFSWDEVVACFNKVTEILASALLSYAESKSDQS